MPLWSAGSNARGQLGHGTEEDAHHLQASFFSDKKRALYDSENVLAVACGANHTLALIGAPSDTGMNQLWGSGDGSKGQLGVISEEVTSYNVFQPLHIRDGYNSYNDRSLQFVAAAWETSFVVIDAPENPILISFGSNDFGLRGVRGDKEDISMVSFAHLFRDQYHPSFFSISHLRAGPRNVFAVLTYREEGTWVDLLVGWGASRHGQLSLLKPEGKTGVKSNISFHSIPTTVAKFFDPDGIEDIACGSQHSLILTKRGTICCLGTNSKRQFPSEWELPSIPSGIGCTWNNSYVSLGRQNKFEGVLSFGNNIHGQLGSDEVGQSVTLVSLPAQIEPEMFAFGSEHVLILGRIRSSVAQLLGWGWNEHGTLGLGHTKIAIRPERIGLPCECIVEDQQGTSLEVELICEKCRGAVEGIWAGNGTSWVFTSR